MSLDDKNTDAEILKAIFEQADQIAATSLKGRPKKDSGYEPKVGVRMRFEQSVVNWLQERGETSAQANALLKALKEASEKHGIMRPVEADQTKERDWLIP